MANTYFVRYESLDPRGWGYGNSHEEPGWERAMAAIWNPIGSGKIVRVKNAKAYHTYAASSTISNRNAANVSTCTGISGGTDLTSTQVFAHDTTGGPLPAEVTWVREPSISGKSLLRQIHTIPQYTPFRNSAQMTTHTMGGRMHNLDMGTILRTGYSHQGGATQATRLREGQGIFIEQTGIRVTGTFHVWVTFTDGTDTYTAYCYYTPFYSEEWVCLFNGVGSGVVLDVLSVEIHEDGDTSEPVFDVAMVENVDTDEEGIWTTETPYALDTANPALGAVKVYRDIKVMPVGAPYKAEPGGTANWSTQRRLYCMPGKYRLSTMLNWGAGPVYSDFFDGGASGQGELVLQEGQGAALMKRRAGMGGRKEISFYFTVEDGTVTQGRPWPIIGGHHIIRSNYGR